MPKPWFKRMELCFSSLSSRYLCLWLVQFRFFFCVCVCVPPTFLPGLVHVSVSRGRDVSSVKKPRLLSERKRVGATMVNVCACGPGQQRFYPAGVSWSSCWMLFISSTEQLRSSDFQVELDRCWKKPFHQPFGPQEQKGLIFWGETEKN